MATAETTTTPETAAPPLPLRWRFSAADFHKLVDAGVLKEDDRVELIHGELFRMSPIGTRHNAVVSRLTHLFVTRLNLRAVVYPQCSIRLDPETEPQPDLALLRPRDDFYASLHPGPADVLLIVEVMDSSSGYDRGTKLPLYASAGIGEVWLVDLNGGAVEVYRGPAGGAYAEKLVLTRGQRVAPGAFPDIEMDAGAALG